MFGNLSCNRLLFAAVGTSPLWLGVLIFIYVPNNKADSPVPLSSVHRRAVNTPDMNQDSFWNNADMKKLDIPSDVIEKSKSILVQESTIKVQGATVFYREAQGSDNADISMLLLHGMAFTSKTWLDLGTIPLIAASGYRVVAVDLPGFGKSPAAKIPEKGLFIHHLIQDLKLTNPVVVSPSMSGTFALPYLLEHWKDMGGYIPVAPVGWEVLENFECNTKNVERTHNVPEDLRKYLTSTLPNLECIQTPTLVVYGEKDRSRNSALLCLLPFSQAAEIPKGAHPAYLTDPDLWHKLLFNFLGYTNLYAKEKSE